MSDYLIDNENQETFNNITNFVKNATLKDSKEIEKYENDYSRFFGKMLLKYYDERLFEKDIIELINKVEEYNSIVDNYFKKENIAYEVYGIPEYPDEQIDKSSIYYKLVKYISDEESKKTENKIDNIKNYVKERLLAKSPEIKNDGYDEIFKKYSLDYFKSKERIFIKAINKTDRDAEKYSASANETLFANNGELMSFFDLQIETTNNDLIDKITTSTSITTQALKISEKSTTGAHILIAYKELNPKYREVLNANAIEILFEELKTVNSNFYNNTVNDESVITSDFYNSLRNQKNEILLIDGTLNSAISYYHVNPYRLRKAEESALVAYYYGDSFVGLSNGYGIYSYQKEEIKNFLDIYEETRQYFYKVLLNKAFINEADYELYEKTFIAIIAIERFMSSKIENLKDIETFNKTDIKNYMESFGLKAVYDKVKDKPFIDSESYLKQLLHNHINIMHEKGSREVIDRLLNIFNFGNTEIDIQKYLLVDETNIETTEIINETNIETTTESKLISSSLKFIPISYNPKNTLKEINNSLKKDSYSYINFIKGGTAGNDEYWDTNLITEDVVKNIGLDTTETKYIGLQLKNNFFKKYIITRYAISLIKNYYTINNSSDSILNTVKITLENDSNRSLIEIINILCYVFSQLLKAYEDKLGVSISVDGKFYGVNKLNEEDIAEPNILLMKELKISSSTDSDSEIINYYENRRLITDPDTKIDEIKNVNGENIVINDAPTLYQYFIEPGIDFPIRYLDGLLYRSNNMNTTNKLDEFCNDLFNKYYLTDTDPLGYSGNEIDKYKITGTPDEIISKASDIIIEICNTLQEVFTSYEYMQFMFSLEKNESNELNFMKSVIEIFISYTTQLKTANYSRNYNTTGESYIMSDDITQIDIHQIRVDNVFYDEKFSIKGGNENEIK